KSRVLCIIMGAQCHPTALEGRAAVHGKLPAYSSIADITLLRTESMAEFDDMRKALEAEYRPAGFIDMEHFEAMLSPQWRLRRVQKAEASMPILGAKPPVLSAI